MEQSENNLGKWCGIVKLMQPHSNNEHSTNFEKLPEFAAACSVAALC